jgi:hypothetical protein
MALRDREKRTSACDETRRQSVNAPRTEDAWSESDFLSLRADFLVSRASAAAASPAAGQWSFPFQITDAAFVEVADGGAPYDGVATTSRPVCV